MLIIDVNTHIFYCISIFLLIEEFVKCSHVGFFKTGLKQNRSLNEGLKSLKNLEARIMISLFYGKMTSIAG